MVDGLLESGPPLFLSLSSILRGFCFNLGRGIGLDRMGISEKLIKAIIEKDFVARFRIILILMIVIFGTKIDTKLCRIQIVILYDCNIIYSYFYCTDLLEFLISEEIINFSGTGKKIILVGISISTSESRNFHPLFDFYWKVKVVFLEFFPFRLLSWRKDKSLRVYHYSRYLPPSFNPDFRYRLRKGKIGILMDRESCAR